MFVLIRQLFTKTFLLFILVDGHDSAEDALAALDLMKYQIMEDYKKLNQKKL